jgi:isopentenyl-diphosphate delta-isomerase
MMKETWQLYDTHGQPLEGQGAGKTEIRTKALLHGASHVWMWRETNGAIKVLLQKRAADKATWPNCYDISAAGHIDLGESPIAAAIRETKEEIGLDITLADLYYIGTQYAYIVAPNGLIEHEYQFLYAVRLRKVADFSLQQAEVASLEWKTLDDFAGEVLAQNDRYVPHGDGYYQSVITAIGQLSSRPD